MWPAHLKLQPNAAPGPATTQMSNPGKSAQKRLLQELRTYETEPNPGLVKLGPVSDQDLFKWETVMRGVEGTAYEGTSPTV